MTDKKLNERAWVTKAFDLCKLPLGPLTAFESPDFLMHTDTGIIGIEVVQYVKGGPKSQEIKRPRFQGTVYQIIKEELEQNLAKLDLRPRCVRIEIEWNVSSTGVCPADALATRIIELLLPVISDTSQHGECELENWGMQVPRLHAQVGAIHVQWIAAEFNFIHIFQGWGGWVYPDIQGLQSIIDLKNEKLPSYKRDVIANYLIVVVTGEFEPTSFLGFDELQQHQFRFHFSKVLVLDDPWCKAIDLTSESST